MTRLSDFDFALPPELIARYPAAKRDDSRLLDVRGGNDILRFDAFPRLLNRGDVVVFNNTKVLPARLVGKKPSGGKVEILFERALTDSEFLAQVGASRPLPVNAEVNTAAGLFKVIGREGLFYRIAAVDKAGERAHAVRRFWRAGQTPLPPYIARPPEEADKRRYQTVYARRTGSVAAPTAGLHFTRETMRAIKQTGAQVRHITLHVGAGTFAPLREDRLPTRLHAEPYDIGVAAARAVNAAKQQGRRVVAVGTTTLRALESAARAGRGTIRPGTAQTELFIAPGFPFAVTDALLTNFHLPRSSLFILVCAFAGADAVYAAYQRAIREGMRFYSYGDAMFVRRQL